MKSIQLGFVGLLLALTPWSVRADIPPPPGYIEQCTVEKQCKNTEEGDACFVADYHQPATCKKKHEKDGFVYKCQAGGGHSWTEIFCRPKAPKK